MNTSHSASLPVSVSFPHHRKPLAVCVASAFALSLPASAFGVAVTSCLDDGGGGTLRSVIAAAAEGATIDLSGLNGMCAGSKISLATAAIPISQNNLTIDGTGSGLTIDASDIPHGGGYGDFRVFAHYGTGTLTIKSLIMRGGYVKHYSPAYGTLGGCIFSSGDVYLYKSNVNHCMVVNTGSTNDAVGGGVFASGDLTLMNSSLSVNTASSDQTNALGGGAYVGGNLLIDSGTLNNNTASASGSAKGAGAYTVGFLTAQNNSTVKYNNATSTSGTGSGGGAYCKGMLTLDLSTVTGNSASGTSVSSGGGGAFVLGNSMITYSTIKYGEARVGGALNLRGAVNSIESSTISGNSAQYAGGVDVYGGGGGTTFNLKNSTISNNYASAAVGGLFTDAATTNLFNSTIAFNTAASAALYAAGVVISANNNPVAANLQSMLISNNSTASTLADLSSFPTSSSVTFTTANNLIRTFSVTNLPAKPLQGCPRLGPLRNNGGRTKTHALLSGSPAIDMGNNGFLGALYDQRGSAAVNGTADYTRFSGPGMLTDIGAYEVQQDEIVFNASFEDCAPLPP